MFRNIFTFFTLLIVQIQCEFVLVCTLIPLGTSKQKEPDFPDPLHRLDLSNEKLHLTCISVPGFLAKASTSMSCQLNTALCPSTYVLYVLLNLYLFIERLGSHAF